jgi:hypothetical protein
MAELRSELEGIFEGAGLEELMAGRGAPSDTAPEGSQVAAGEHGEPDAAGKDSR